jgi:hypothetical protein
MLILFGHCFLNKYTSLSRKRNVILGNIFPHLFQQLAVLSSSLLLRGWSKHSIRHQLTSFVCEEDEKEKGTKVVREWLIKNLKAGDRERGRSFCWKCGASGRL